MNQLLNKNNLFAISFLILITIASLISSLLLNNGDFSYALDDPYIHMTTVKHFVEQGIWSVDGYSYASASSSPLWVITLSPFYLLVGAKFFVYVPFILNVFFQILSLILIFKIIKAHTYKELHYIFGIAIVLFTPFVALSFGGMEHSMQIFLVLLMISLFLSYINQPDLLKYKIYILLLAPFVVFIRYEDLALITAMSIIILFYFKDYKFAIGLIISSLLFIVVFGLWSKYILDVGFIPSSIMAKSMIGNEINFLFQIKSIVKNFLYNFLVPHIVALYVINLYILIKSFTLINKKLFLLTILFILTLFAHSAFAKMGWLYRYEAYLIIFGLVNIFIYLYSLNVKWAYLILIFALPIFSQQTVLSLYRSIHGSKNVYEQQMQMANFLHDECNTCSVGANDIGEITYFTDIHLLDLYGLGSYEVMKLLN